MKTFLQDVSYAVRSFSQTPAFALAVIASLAIGIGVNTALFSVTQAVLLRPLPYADADRLAILWNRSPGLNIAEDWFSTAQYFDVKNSSKSFEDVGIVYGVSQNLTGDGNPERVSVRNVSSNLLPLLGAKPALGRLFTVEEDANPPAHTAILMHGMWKRRYGSDPGVLGKKLILNGNPYEIVGVLPEDFTFSREVIATLYGDEEAEILLPFPLAAAAASNRGNEDYNIVAKLRPGISTRQAQAEMDALTARLRRDFPEVYPPNGGLTFSVVPLHEQVVGQTRRPLLILLGAVGFVLLICCANVASLLLARAVNRQKEIAVRQALGADRKRVLQQLLSESVTLAVAGGVAGVVLAYASLQGLYLLGPRSVPRLEEIGINGTVLLFTLALAVISGLLFGLAPALRLARIDLHTTLNEAGRGSSGSGAAWSRSGWMRKLLVAAQMALSVMLLIGAGLLIRSFILLKNVNPGFNSQGVLTAGVTMTGQKYSTPEAILETYRRIWEEFGKIPGVTAAGGNSFLPMNNAFAWGPVTIEGRAPLPGEQFINADMRIVGGRYFEAMQIPLKSGRLFNEFDMRQNPRVVLVDEYLAAQMWPGQDPLGKRLKFGGLTSESPWMSVVGVVGRVKQYSLESDDRIALYIPQTQAPRREMYFTLRSQQDPDTLATALRAAIRQIDPDLPVYSVRTMDSRVEESLARRRFSTVLLGLFAAVAMVLAALGVYGMLAYQVSQGTREIGIRMALGASQTGILRLILGQGARVALAGIALGMAGALALSRLLQSMVFGIHAADPATFTVIPVLLGGLAVLASIAPALRASRIDPAISLRWE